MSVLRRLSPILGTILSHWRLGVLVALIAAFGWGWAQVRAAESARVRAELALDSLEAVNDTTRLRLVETLEGRVRVFERRAVQTEQKLDSLDEQLGWTASALVEAEARVDELETTVVGVIDREAGPDSVPAAEYELRQEPYTIWARAIFDDPPVLRLRVALDPIPLGVRVGCGPEPEDGGIRTAVVGIQSPEWAEVNIASARQSPEVCNPTAPLLDPDSFWDGATGTAVKGAAAGAGLYGAWRLLSWWLGG